VVVSSLPQGVCQAPFNHFTAKHCYVCALQVSGPGPHKETYTSIGQAEGQAEGGTSGGIAGAWRGMTSSFSVGADDMAGDSSAGTIQGGCGVE
jgi:hypothetical protein